MNKWLNTVGRTLIGKDLFGICARCLVASTCDQAISDGFPFIKKRIGFASLALVLWPLLFTQTVHSAPCAASGNTLSGARTNFAQQCSTEQRRDCDYIGSLWYCSNEQIGEELPGGLAGSASTNTNNTQSSSSNSGTSGSTSGGECVDPDGDGFGWNGASCRVTPTSTSGSGSSGNSNNTGSTSVSTEPDTDDSAECLDPDGDGWGWNGASCRVSSSSSGQTNTGSQSTATSASNSGSTSGSGQCLDPDGDGYGWNGATCRVAPTNSQSGTGSSSSGSSSSTDTVRASDITDLILLTGQSNALGANTAYDSSLDSPDNRVFAFTSTGWQRANLNQIWDRGWHPRNNPDTDPSNNLLLHFGKRVVSRDSNRVVGFILVSAPGAPIANWDYNGEFYQAVSARVLDAINQLSHKSQLDGILWHQGETDAQDTPLYGSKLYALISNLRSENWFSNGRPFICGEIAKRGGVNNQLNRLNTDGDSSTACVSAAGVETKFDNSHFTAVGLREIGRRYGDRYFQMTR